MISLLQLLQLIWDFCISVVKRGLILFRIPAWSAPVFDNIEAAIKEMD